MKVLVENATGSSRLQALLDKDSGVLEYSDGEISHVLFEKNLNKKITIVRDAPKFIYPDQTEPETTPASKATEEQSAPVKKSKPKAK